jgi:hypothetical protein
MSEKIVLKISKMTRQSCFIEKTTHLCIIINKYTIIYCISVHEK